jgi:hypothetical protein
MKPRPPARTVTTTYSYVIPEISDDPVALEITGQSPFAAWTSWTIYTDLQAGVQPFSVVRDAAITPDEGSVNPFVVGKPVLAPKRGYRLLVLPKGTDTATIGESLRDVPSSNILSRPTTDGFYLLANRVYNAFPGYNQGCAAGPTNTPFPTVRAVNYQTGEDLDCSMEAILQQDHQGRSAGYRSYRRGVVDLKSSPEAKGSVSAARNGDRGVDAAAPRARRPLRRGPC